MMEEDYLFQEKVLPQCLGRENKGIDIAWRTWERRSRLSSANGGKDAENERNKWSKGPSHIFIRKKFKRKPSEGGIANSEGE